MTTAASGATLVPLATDGSAHFLRMASVWEPGSLPSRVEREEACNSDAIRWFDIDPNLCDATQVLALLEGCCEGLTIAMVEDLLEPDAQPEGKPFHGGVRLVSTFSVEARRNNGPTPRGEASGTGHLVFSPVELLAGEDWVLSCWHPSRTFLGANPIDALGQALLPEDLFDNVGQRWETGAAACAGDLGVLIMHELALTYVPTVRAIASWLEDWELRLYVTDEPDRCSLARLWGSMAVMRDWLNPLNRPGLRTHVDKAWLPARDHGEVIAVDDRVDKALDNLRRLADALRGSFQVLHVELNEEQRDHAEKLQRRVELIATALLVPTLVVGFYGANTWVPGQGQRWGFWVMVAALIALSAAALGIVRYVHRAHQRDEDGISAERRALEAELRRV